MDVKKPEGVLSIKKDVKQNYAEFFNSYETNDIKLVKTYKDVCITIEISKDCDFFSKIKKAFRNCEKIDLSEIGEGGDFFMSDSLIEKMNSCVFYFFKRIA